MSANYTTELVQSLRDWINHLSGSYIFINAEDGQLLPLEAARIFADGRPDPDHEFSAHQLSVVGIGMKPDLSRDEISIPLSKCTVGFPSLGMTDGDDGKGTARFFFYRARRQFRKSLSPSMVGNYVPHSDAARAFLDQRIEARRSISLRRLYQTVNGIYAPLGECYDSLLRGDAASRAVARNFAIAATFRSPNPLLVYRKTDIGYVDEHAVYIHSDFADLCEEFEETAQVGAVIYE